MNPNLQAIVWLIVGILTIIFAVVRLVGRDVSPLTIIAPVAGLLLVLGALGVWP